LLDEQRLKVFPEERVNDENYAFCGLVERNNTQAATMDVDTTVNTICVFHPV
jgi:hypothetical protein